jgi:hypothetical protein
MTGSFVTYTGLQVENAMEYLDCAAIYSRHGLEVACNNIYEVATVLGGLEAELAYITSEAHTQTHEYAVKLIPMHVELMQAQDKIEARDKRIEALEAQVAALSAYKLVAPTVVERNGVTGEYQEQQ